MNNVTITQEEYNNLLAAKAFQESAEGQVLVTQSEFDDLLHHYQFLCALNATGVGGWEGYESARSLLKLWQSENEDE